MQRKASKNFRQEKINKIKLAELEKKVIESSNLIFTF